MTEATPAILVDMRALLAANVIAGHKNTKNRETLRSVYLTPDLAIGCDSYRLVAVGHGDLKDAGPADLHAAVISPHAAATSQAPGIMVPADLLVTVAKIAKVGLVKVGTDGRTVSVEIPSGQTFTAPVPCGEYPNFGTLFPALDAGVSGASWSTDYLADVAKIGKPLACTGPATLLTSDPLKPSLWHIPGMLKDVGNAIYLLMPIRTA